MPAATRTRRSTGGASTGRAAWSRSRSNDGYLLRNFVEAGIPALGVEPAANVAAVAVESGVPTVVDFFGADVRRARRGDRARRPDGGQQRAGARARHQRLRRRLRGAAAPDRRRVTFEFPHLLRPDRGRRSSTRSTTSTSRYLSLRRVRARARPARAASCSTSRSCRRTAARCASSRAATRPAASGPSGPTSSRVARAATPASTASRATTRLRRARRRLPRRVSSGAPGRARRRAARCRPTGRRQGQHAAQLLRHPAAT